MRISLSSERRQRCMDAARRTVFSARDAAYPDWYLQHWHFLPEGYLSRRSAAAYEAAIPRLYNALRETSAITAVLERVRPTEARDVLELGCGPGHLLRAVAQALPGTRITGVDLSPFQLERAAAAVKELTGVTLLHGDAASTALDDESFDVVAAMHVLGHMPMAAATRVMAEARRLLRPGGRLMVVDHRWHPAVRAWGLRTSDREALLGGLARVETFERT